MVLTESLEIGRKSMIALGVMLALAHAGIVQAAVDGYGNTVVGDGDTGYDYACAGALLQPRENYCDDNPFVLYDADQDADTFIDSIGTETGQSIHRRYFAEVDSASPFALDTSDGDIDVYEGNQVLPIRDSNTQEIVTPYILNAQDAGSQLALFKNLATGVRLTATSGAVIHVHSNNADGAELTTDADSTIYLNRNSAVGAELVNYGKMILEGNGAENAKITTHEGSELDLIHSNSDGFFMVLNGGRANLYDVQANVANITVAAGAELFVADCSPQITDCRDDVPVRGTSLQNGAELINNGGTVNLSGTINLTDSEFRNGEGGQARLMNASIDGGAIDNFGELIFSQGAVVLNVPVDGNVDLEGEGRLVMQSGANVQLQAAGSLRNPTLEINGGQIGFELNSSGSNPPRIVVGSVQLPDAAAPVQLNITAGTGAPTTGDGIEVVTVTGGPAQSPANAFVMTPFSNNGVTYSLVRGDSGNWYVRSTLAAGINPKSVPTMGVGVLGFMSLVLAALGIRRMRPRAQA